MSLRLISYGDFIVLYLRLEIIYLFKAYYLIVIYVSKPRTLLIFLYRYAELRRRIVTRMESLKVHL